MKVLAAMSGGVDSAVAAARAVEAGHEVVGVHLALSRMPGTLRTGSRGCCTVEDSNDAWRACDKLGIPYYVWDFSERFKEDVVDDFIAEYEAGRTPNPCMRCNERIKFAALLEKAIALGFDAVCTGHYAKVDPRRRRQPGAAPRRRLGQGPVLRAGRADPRAARALHLPAGATPRPRPRSAPRPRPAGSRVANKPDSHDICFIPDGDTRGWLAERIDVTQGEILDREGKVLGQHEGAHAFTVGQRKGLKLGVPAADGKPRFVLEIRPKENKVIVGPEALLAVDELRGIRISWAGLPIADAESGTEFDCMVQVRAHGDPVDARAQVQTLEDGSSILVATLVEPMRGVAPGQTMVVYQGTRVLGQATIDSARSAAWDSSLVS